MAWLGSSVGCFEYVAHGRELFAKTRQMSFKIVFCGFSLWRRFVEEAVIGELQDPRLREGKSDAHLEGFLVERFSFLALFFSGLERLRGLLCCLISERVAYNIAKVRELTQDCYGTAVLYMGANLSNTDVRGAEAE